MKRVIVALTVVPFILLAISCTRDIEESSVPDNYDRVSFTATLDEPATKTVVNTASGKVYWQIGDLIRCYSKSGGEVSSVNVETLIDGGAARIDLNLSQSSLFGIAVYGGTGLSDRENDGCTIEGAITAEQTGDFTDSHVAVVKVKKINNQWPEDIRFSNVIPFVSFELEGNADDAEYAVFKSGAGERLHSDGRLYVTFDGTAVDDVKLSGEGGGNSIKIPITGPKVYYIALAPGVYHGFSLSFYKKNSAGIDEYLGTVASEKTLDLSNCRALVKLGAIDGKIQRVSTDLSAAGEANCYVVPEPGDYKIPVRFANAVFAKVVWESTMSSDAPHAGEVVYNLELKDGFLHFASGVDGNAVIGVADDEDAILWSWHIWVCKGYNPEASAYATVNGKAMDRAIGALDDKSAGLLYQWGRKDPFLAEGLASTPAFQTPITSSEKNGTVARSIKYPSVLINPNDATEGDWLYATRDNSLWSSLKTDYDPCPPGWQLPVAFGEYANGWVSGNYWSCATSGSKAFAWNGNETIAMNRGALATVRCVAGMNNGETPPDQNVENPVLTPVHQTSYLGKDSFDYRYVSDKYWKVDYTPVSSTVEKLYQIDGQMYGGATIIFPPEGKRIPAIEGSSGRKVANILAWTKNNGDYLLGGRSLVEYDTASSISSIENFSWFWNWGDLQNGDINNVVSWQPSSPEVESFDQGRIKIAYSINGADVLGSATDGMSCLQLGASYEKDGNTKVVTSDYEPIVPYREAFHKIAFKLSSPYRTNAEDCPLATDGRSPYLYSTAIAAAEERYSVPVPYDEGPFRLDFLDIHMKMPDTTPHAVGSDEKAYSLAELQRVYPNLKFHFEPVSYSLGLNDTEQDKYCNIYEDFNGDWWFLPMYVNRHKYDGNGAWDTSASCPASGDYGISAVGRRPIVLVTLIDTANKDKVILEGYFKVEIVKKTADSNTPFSSNIACHMFDFDPFGLLCDPEPDPADPADIYNNWEQYNYRRETKWAIFSSLVLENTLRMSYDQFRKTFDWESAKTYIRKNGQMVATDDYGRVIYVPDTCNGGGNGKFVILFRKANYDKFVADNITEKEIYAHFSSAGQGGLWLGFKVSIIDKPKVTFVEKNPNYWYDDLKEKNYEQNIRVGTKVPESTYDDVTVCNRFFDDSWVGNGVKIALATYAVSQWYKYIWNTLPVEYEYFFSKSQDSYTYPDPDDPTKNKTAKFYVSADRKTVYIDPTMLHPVAKIATEYYESNYTEKFNYLCNDYSKELLNAYDSGSEVDGSFNNTNISEMLYFKIDLTATYGMCMIPCGSYSFPLRLIRPLSIKNGESVRLKDAVNNGNNVEIGTLFSVVDWLGIAVFSYRNNNYIEGMSNGVNLYNYYGLSTVQFDVDNAMTDQTGDYKYIFDGTRGGVFIEGVNKSASLWVAYKYDIQTAITRPLSITQASSLANYVLHYENDSAAASNYHLKIPFTITYKWGAINGAVVIPVDCS